MTNTTVTTILSTHRHMIKHTTSRALAPGFIMLTLASPCIANESAETDFAQGYDIPGVSYSVVPVRQGTADMDNGGSFSLSSAQLRLAYIKPVSTQTLAGISFNYNHIDYTFTSPSAFGGQAPWDKIRSIDIGFPVLGRLSEQWSYMLVPSLGTYGEYDARQSDSRTYGIVLAAGYRVAPGRRIGFGVGAFDRLDESKLFPFLSLNWQLTDQLTISNPLRAGPTGAAGLELSYRLKHQWETGLGFARRNLLFRLDETGAAPGGSGAQIGRLAYLRLSRNLDLYTRLSLHLGVVRESTLELRARNDALLASTDNDTAPMLALSFESRF